MEYTPEEYTRYYIIQALFKLMSEYEYDKISVTDIAHKAGVGRATFYRYFKRKEDVLIYYFEHNTKDFIFSQRFYPRCKEDHMLVIENIFTRFKDNKEPFKLIRKARMEHVYLDFLNKNFINTFQNDYPQNNSYTPYLFAGMLFNVSMAWLDNDCREPIENLVKAIVDVVC